MAVHTAGKDLHNTLPNDVSDAKGSQNLIGDCTGSWKGDLLRITKQTKKIPDSGIL